MSSPHRGRNHRASNVGVSTNQPLRDRILAGLIDQGHGREACAAYLGLTDEQLMSRIVHLDLPTPAERPMRVGHGAHAWDVTAIRQLIDFWIRDLTTSRIAAHLGRSPSGVRSKARWLGLYKRARNSLLNLLPLFPGIDIEPRRHQLVWTDELERWLADRWFSFQHHKALAADLSSKLGFEVSPSTIASKAHRLELPRRDPDFLLQDYKPEYRARHSRLLPKMYERRCKIRGRLFWSTGATFTSEEAKAQSNYRSLCAGVSDHGMAAIH
ncbi:hypothetical protein [Belnapia rosea]|uniref:hypothetical protein n=1 Tax=Belnapia rosea TaxID=938405 RepID=UPI00088032D8|nr:hypothetical protein [Belnapia rosea]SDB71494.1 hypothetical protein SAMN02927895_04111 [Belnapia rosea]